MNSVTCRRLSPQILLLITAATAVLVNVTVDDSLPDPLTGEKFTYLPDASWKTGSSCKDCSAAPNGEDMYDASWHDGTYFPAHSNLAPTGPLNISFAFNGTAIYVFCAIALSLSNPTGYSNMTFYIDGNLDSRYEMKPPGILGYQYNTCVYSKTNLSPGPHTFMLVNGQPNNTGNKSLTLFDYLVYSYDDSELESQPNSSQKKPTQPSTNTSKTTMSPGAIVGCVLGAVVSMILGGLLIRFLARRRRTISSRVTSIEPYLSQGSSSSTGHGANNTLFISPPVYRPASAVQNQPVDTSVSPGQAY